MALGKFKLALRDFETVKKRRPRDPDALVSQIGMVWRIYLKFCDLVKIQRLFQNCSPARLR